MQDILMATVTDELCMCEYVSVDHEGKDFGRAYGKQHLVNLESVPLLTASHLQKKGD